MRGIPVMTLSLAGLIIRAQAREPGTSYAIENVGTQKAIGTKGAERHVHDSA